MHKILSILLALFQKNGEFSKTSVMLWGAYLIVAAKYFFANQTVWGYPFGPFDEIEALSFLGIVGGVYVGSSAAGHKRPPGAPAPSANGAAPGGTPAQPLTSTPTPVDPNPQLLLELLKAAESLRLNAEPPPSPPAAPETPVQPATQPTTAPATEPPKEAPL